MRIRLHNKAPIDVKLEEYKYKYKYKYKPYERELKSLLIDTAFYSVETFLCYWLDTVAAWTEKLTLSLPN
jgi:hypothetical protein